MGHFISVEGGEGVGKSTFCQALAERLMARGETVTRTREPGGTPTAQRIRELFLHPPSDDPLVAEAELFLIAAARAQHVARLIKPALEKVDWVISDRFYDSTRVYQGVMAGLPQDLLERSIEYAVGDCHPELTFVLDCDTAVALKRLASRASQNVEDESNRFDAAQFEYHQRLRQGFLDLQQRFPARVVVLDATKPLDQLLSHALELIDQKFLGN